ncbi:MAG: hypothetical protein ACI9O2_000241, partial [Flammeovirgaceae bacterium]
MSELDSSLASAALSLPKGLFLKQVPKPSHRHGENTDNELYRQTLEFLFNAFDGLQN